MNKRVFLVVAVIDVALAAYFFAQRNFAYASIDCFIGCLMLYCYIDLKGGKS